MNLLKYFDLNQRIFDWNRSTKQTNKPNRQRSGDNYGKNLFLPLWILLTRHPEGQISLGEQLLMYLGVLLGVYFSGMVRGQEVRPTFVLAAFIALTIVPIAFEKLSINPKAPFLSRFGLFVQQGVFWDVLLQIGDSIRRH
jgi:hypothetical protein